MTSAHKKGLLSTENGAPSLLPFNPADLISMRVLPAEFARMVDVSKQTVSRWIKEGKVSLGPDGRVDPAKATREVLQRTDPARLRARLFKSVTESREELRARTEAAEAALRAAAAERDRVETQLSEVLSDYEAHPKAFIDLVTECGEHFAEAFEVGCLREWLECLFNEAVIPGWLEISANDRLPSALWPGEPLRRKTEETLSKLRSESLDGH